MNWQSLPRRTIADRVAACRLRVEAAGLDAFWFLHPPDVRYLSGFTGEDTTLLLTRRRTLLVTDSRYEEQADDEAEADEVVVRHKGMALTVAELCRGLGVRRLGLSSREVTHADWETLTSELPASQVAAGETNPAHALRMRKGREEVAAIVAAMRLAEEAFRRFAPSVAPGRSEKWLAANLEREMREAGADGPAFPTICAAGARASMPHAVPGDRELGRNTALLVDWGARIGGYSSDLTRLVCTGTMPGKVEELTQVVLQAQEAAFRKAGPGVPCAEVDRASRSVIARAGYGPFFGHSLGHGVGLEVHEGPRVGPGEEQVLLPGMVFTVEPGVYLPGVAGARIEDVIVITSGGFDRLSSLDSVPAAR